MVVLVAGVMLGSGWGGADGGGGAWGGVDVGDGDVDGDGDWDGVDGGGAYEGWWWSRVWCWVVVGVEQMVVGGGVGWCGVDVGDGEVVYMAIVTEMV